MEKKMLSFIDYNDIIDNQYTFFAHMKEGKKELLQDHIYLSQEYFMKLYDYKDIEKIIYTFMKECNSKIKKLLLNFLKVCLSI